LPKSDAASTSSAEEEPEDEALPEFVTITDVLDLHGTPPEIIPQMIADFIANAIELKLEQVQIIHGKGRSRLKLITMQSLSEHPRVQNFHDAAPELGGWGRTVVTLDLSRENRDDSQATGDQH
jgi:DNA-nicking Smr family endonuclease